MSSSATKGTWYVATLILQCKVEGHDKLLKLVDEQVRVLRAIDIETAYKKAVQLGKQGEISYENVFGEIVHWNFVGLGDLEELPFDDEIKDGTEVKYRLFRKKDPHRLVRAKDELTVFSWERERRHRKAGSLVKPNRES